MGPCRRAASPEATREFYPRRTVLIRYARVVVVAVIDEPPWWVQGKPDIRV
jgi:hypothetical protein